MHLHRSRRLTTATDAPTGAATSSAGILAAQRARQYLSGLVEAAIDRVFFEPLDVSTEAEALALLADREDGSRLRAAMLGASEWALARYARRKLLPRMGTKVAVWTGGKTAGKVILPITLSIEVTLAARDGVRELQVLGSFLMSRLARRGAAGRARPRPAGDHLAVPLPGARPGPPAQRYPAGQGGGAPLAAGRGARVRPAPGAGHHRPRPGRRPPRPAPPGARLAQGGSPPAPHRGARGRHGAMNRLGFTAPAGLTVEEVEDRLVSAGLRPEPPTTVQRTYYDTFDARLYRPVGCSSTSALLDGDEAPAPRAGASWLRLRPLAGAQAVLEQPATSIPRRADDLADDRLRVKVGDLAGGRALLAQLEEAPSRERLFRCLGPEDKTVARVVVASDAGGPPTVASGRASGRAPSVWALPVRGYDDELAALARALDGLIGGGGVADPFEVASRAAGRDPGVDPSAFDVRLEPDWPADAAVRALLGRLFEVMVANEAGVRGDLDEEFLHDFRGRGPARPFGAERLPRRAAGGATALAGGRAALAGAAHRTAPGSRRPPRGPLRQPLQTGRSDRAQRRAGGSRAVRGAAAHRTAVGPGGADGGARQRALPAAPRRRPRAG